KRERKRQRRMGRSRMALASLSSLLSLSLSWRRRMGRRRIGTIRRPNGIPLHAVLRLVMEDVETELLLGQKTHAAAEIV
ncbi:hypothetical protein PFISCL1PPCAC_16506, partial [Pristionchus fissidentatus]